MMCHYPDLGRASDWSNQVFPTAQPIRSTTQIWVVTHQISALVSLRSFGRETGGSVSKCWLFSQAIDSVDNSDCYCFQCQEKKNVTQKVSKHSAGGRLTVTISSLKLQIIIIIRH